MLSENSKIFFLTFFLAIALCIGATYINIYVLGNYNTFTDPDNVPEPTDIYVTFFDLLKGGTN